MKLARVAVLGVAVGAGLVAAVIAMRLVQQPPPPPEPVVVEATAAPVAKVLVAAVDLPKGTTISAGAMEWRDWPPNGVSPQFFTEAATPDEITSIVDAGTIVRESFYAGEPIIEGKLIRNSDGYMAAILESGMRAVATGISVVTSAGGFVLPNDRVDVIMVRHLEGALGRGNDYLTEVILSNIRILAIDQTIEDQGGKKVVVGQTATLELTPRQAQILAAAQPMAERLMLSLRSFKDTEVTPEDQDADAVYLIDGSRREGVVTVVKNGISRDVSGLR